MSEPEVVCWVDEPAFKGVYPELTAYPGLRETFINFTSSYNRGLIGKEENIK